MKQCTYTILDLKLLVLICCLYTGRNFLFFYTISLESFVFLPQLFPSLFCFEVSLFRIIILFSSFIEPLFQTSCPLFFSLGDLLLLLKSLSSFRCLSF